MQFGFNEILTMIDKVESAGLAAFEYRDADTQIKIKGQSVPAVREDTAVDMAASGSLQPTVSPDKGAHEEKDTAAVLSPMVGTFYGAPAEDADDFVHVGDRVTAGQVVGIVEAMKLMNEIEAEWTGIVTDILVSNGDLVEYGQPLMRIRPE